MIPDLSGEWHRMRGEQHRRVMQEVYQRVRAAEPETLLLVETMEWYGSWDSGDNFPHWEEVEQGEGNLKTSAQLAREQSCLSVVKFELYSDVSFTLSRKEWFAQRVYDWSQTLQEEGRAWR